MECQLVGHEAFRSPVARNLVIAGNTQINEASDAPLDLFKDGYANKQTGWYAITPVCAQWVLDNYNSNNRTYSKTYARLIERNIESLGYQKTGEPIIFSEDGTLIDGQHRLGAIISTGTQAEILVVFGVESGSRIVCGKGKLRRDNEILQIMGVQNAKELYPVLHMLYELDNIGMLSRQCTSGGWLKYTKKPTANDLLSLYNRDTSINESLLACKDFISKKYFMFYTMVALYHWYRKNIDQNMSDRFLDLVTEWMFVKDKRHPAYQLGSFLEVFSASKTSPLGKLNREKATHRRHVIEAYMIAWEHMPNFRLNLKLESLTTSRNHNDKPRKTSRLITYLDNLVSLGKDATFSVLDEDKKQTLLRERKLI